jgi:hypothetical protein
MQSIEFPSDTDGALSPPVRSNYSKSTSDSLKRKFSVLESRAIHAGPAKRQQTLTAFHQATKSGSQQNHTNSRDLLDARVQKARVANNVHGGGRPAGGSSALNGYQTEVQKQIEASRKAAAAAQERQRAAARKEQDDVQRLASDREKVAARQRLANHRAEQDAWLDRASVTAHNSTSRPGGLPTFPSAAADREQFATVRQRLETHRAEQDASINRAAAARNSTPRPAGLPSHSNAPARPQPTAATRPHPRPKTTKQSPSILGQLSADTKRAKERQAREAKARKEYMRAASEDITDSEAQQEAEANHAIIKPPPYQPLRPLNIVPGAHALSRPRPHDPLRTSRTIPEANGEAAPEIDTDDDELVLEPSPPQQGPFSLNSAAGIRALQKSQPRPPLINLPFDDDVPTQTTTQRFMATGTPKTKFTLKKPTRNQDLLPITASDLKLYQWREQKINWAEVRQLYSDFTGIFPLISEDNLRARFRQVSKVVEIGVVTDEMCERVINGDEAAAAELNRLAGQYIDSSATTTPSAGLEAAPFKKIAKQTPAPRGATVPPPPAAAAAAPRPTQGGKMLDHDTYLVLLDHAAGVDATGDNSDSNSSRAQSPIVDENRVHFEYYMQHRYYHSEDIDNDFGDQEDSETQWVEHNSSFAHAGIANAEAVQYVMTVPEGVPAIFKPAEEWQLTHMPLKEGMSQFSMKTAHGLVQTKVDRRLWTWQDHVMPETKEGWVPKTVYGVFVKKTERGTRMVKKKKTTTEKAAAAVVVVEEADKDSLFGDEEEAEKADDQDEGEEEEEVEESYIDFDFYQVDHAIYGDVNQANQEAIKEWVQLTMKPSSANLDEFACRCAEARQELQRRLEEAPEGTVFSEVWEDDEKTVEVFAEALTMKGARN